MPTHGPTENKRRMIQKRRLKNVNRISREAKIAKREKNNADKTDN